MSAEPERTEEQRAEASKPGPMSDVALEKAYFGKDAIKGKSLWHNTFKTNRTIWAADTDPLVSGWSWMFLTKPDMNLWIDEPSIPAFYTAQEALRLADFPDRPEMVEALQWSRNKSSSFVRIATNLCVNAPFADIAGDTYQAFENFVAQGISLGGHTTASRAMQEMTVSYKELDGTPILRMHDIWVKYIELAGKGLVQRTDENHKARVLDYAASIYVFHVKPDGRTINMWCKYSGVFPTSVPWSAMQSEIGTADAVKVDIPYAYSWYEVNDTDILFDFNAVSSGTLYDVSPLEDDDALEPRDRHYLTKNKTLKKRQAKKREPREQNLFQTHDKVRVISADSSSGFALDFYSGADDG